MLFTAVEAAEVGTMKIERVTSPGGIEAWLSKSHANPLIALRFAFRGGASQDPPGKEGLAYFVSAMMDEGAGPLDSVTFQERAEELAMRMDFDASRDVMLGSLQTLSENKDEVFDLMRLVLSEPRFDEDAIERVRAQILASLKFDENDPETVAALAWDRLAFQHHPYGRPIKGTKDFDRLHHARRSRGLRQARLRARQAAHFGGRRHRRGDSRQGARPHVRRFAGNV